MNLTKNQGKILGNQGNVRELAGIKKSWTTGVFETEAKHCVLEHHGFTGWEPLIRRHSSARFCFELSGNSI